MKLWQLYMAVTLKSFCPQFRGYDGNLPMFSVLCPFFFEFFDLCSLSFLEFMEDLVLVHWNAPYKELYGDVDFLLFMNSLNILCV